MPDDTPEIESATPEAPPIEASINAQPAPEEEDLPWLIEPEAEAVVWSDPEGDQSDKKETKTGDESPETEESPAALPDEASEIEAPPPEIEESQWLDLTLAEADAILIRLHREAKAAPGDPILAVALYEAQAWSAGATVWHERKYAMNPQQAARAHAAQARHRLTLEALLPRKDAGIYEQLLKRLGETLHQRLEAKAALEAQATLEAKVGDLAEALDRMSKQVAVAMIRNKTRVVEIDPPPPRTKGNPSPPILRAMAKQDFFDLYAHERYPIGDDQVSVAKVWFAAKSRQTYKKGIGFDPSHVGTRPRAPGSSTCSGLRL